ncbi:retinol dehydrogenase 12-like [Acanthaster planci]|uniref:Retinol dehydrogenase 12-like n=1 Tax=Acanthaster planci TaxID=133434 RepID=A0A8B7Z822_ACAPL|nr:retinol dehydrogenase 12-like [Acanthaster planci]XP_022099437.1 retinol dehydrogenase 12-like [Acanthaster planci]
MSVLLAVLALVLSGFILSMWSLRRYIAGGWCYSRARLDGKTVIITGANAGIGKETARDLARRGARVIMACRDVSKATSAREDIRGTTSRGQLVVRQLDLASLASVRAFADKIKEEEPRLHVLINSAGVMMCPRQLTEDGFEMHFGVNHLGHFLLTNLLLDLLKSSSPARVVNVSSIAHGSGKIHWDDVNMTNTYDRFDAYGQSKLANMLFTRELSKRLEGTGVTANCLHPGVVQTQLFRHIQAEKPDGVVGLAMSLINLAPGFFFKSAIEGAQTSIYSAVAEELTEISGMYFADCAPRMPSAVALNEEEARKLWTLSARLVGLEKRVEWKKDSSSHCPKE